MPYITQRKRAELDESIQLLANDINAMKLGEDNNTEGNMNYAITKLLISVYGPNWRYRHINDVVGVLECAKLEFYRRAAAPYETQKSFEEGDVY